MARQFMERQTAAGRTAAQIEATHDYITGWWREMAHHTADQAERFRGYTELVGSELALLREAEAEAPRAQHEMELEAGCPHRNPAGGPRSHQEEEKTSMRVPFITAHREWKEYERQEEARVAENMEAIEAHQAEQEQALAEPVLDDSEFDADGNPSADSDADAAQYEHDPSSWLARDGDGRVLEADADAHPRREASTDDGRPVAGAFQREDDHEARAPYPDHGWAVTGPDGDRLAPVGVTAPNGDRFVTWSATEQGARVAWPEAQGYTHELIGREEEAR